MNRVAPLRYARAMARAGICLCWLLAATPAFAGDCLHFGYTEDKTSFMTDVMHNFRTAMREADICVKLVPVPPLREVMMMKSGALDGTLVRVPAFKRAAGDTAIMLSVPLGEASGDLVTRDAAFTSLAAIGTRRVGVALGSRWSNALTRGLPAASVHAVRTETQLLDMLRHGRVDGILITSLQLQRLRQPSDRLIVTPLVSLSGYPWVTPANRARIPALEAAIRAFLASGRRFTDPPG